MYLSSVYDNLCTVLPITCLFWGIAAVSMAIDMRRFRNSFFVTIALFLTLFDAAALFGEYMPAALAGIFFLIFLILLFVPVILVLNGIHMLKREGKSLANILSLVFGLVIGLGEVCTFAGVLGIELVMRDPFIHRLFDFTALSVFYVCVVFLSFMFYSLWIQYIPHFTKFDYVVVLGCGLLQGNRMSKLLAGRCDKAMEIYRRSRRKPILIPSGGQGPDETIPEARAMAEYMIANGIPKEHILPEDRSMNTMENLLNSRKLIEQREGRKHTIVVTSNYHLYRALSYSRKLKFRCSGAGAKVAGYYWPSALIREFAAILREKRHLILFTLGYLLFLTPLLLL